MGLDHLASNNGLQKEQLIRDILDGVSGDAKKLEGNIKEKVDETTLVKAIENNFKKGGNWIEYSKMKNSGYHGFLTQASIDLLSNKLNDCKFNEQGIVDNNGKTLDQWLKDAGGIDNIYLGGTTKLVKMVQKILGYSGKAIDGDAGPKFFEDIIRLLQSSDPSDELIKIQQKNIRHGMEFIPEGIEQLENIQEAFGLGEHRSKLLDTNKFPLMTNLETNIMKKFNESTKDHVCDFYIRFGAGTDATDVKPGKLTENDFEEKRGDIVTLLLQSKIPNRIELAASMGNFGEEQTTFKNNWLLGMRNLEAIQGTIIAYNNSSFSKQRWADRPKVHFIYDPLLNKSGDQNNAESQRFLQVDISYNYTKPNIVMPWNHPLT